MNFKTGTIISPFFMFALVQLRMKTHFSFHFEDEVDLKYGCEILDLDIIFCRETVLYILFHI